MPVHREDFMHLRLAASILALNLATLFAVPANAAEPLFQLELQGKKVTGTPLFWTEEKVFLLGANAGLIEFAPKDAQNFRQATEPFTPLGAAALRNELVREFGGRFEISGTGRYLVVHPVGQKDAWASRFEDLYRSFVHYFSARGFRPNEPRFPLVAVVLGSQQEFQRYAQQEGFKTTQGLMGFYSARTNRVYLYDFTAGKPGVDWTINGETIIHEAAHQTAFNTGVHTRFADSPRWVIEGLGCQFEARGVWNARQFGQREDRVNAYRLAAFRQYMPQRPAGSLAEFVSSDRQFDRNVEAAYAEAWGLMFFLSETEPRKWIDYLKVTANRKPFEHYRSPERLRDFSAIFGADLRMLEVRFLRFMQDVK
jgi:hypothetical protein